MAQQPIPLLQNVRVAAPCSASWEAMREVDGDRVRFCEHCQFKVYNLSEMGQAEAEGLLRSHEGRLCVRYYRREDGTILTQDCPAGVRLARAAKKMLVKRFAAAAALVPCLWKAATFLNHPQPVEVVGQRVPTAVVPPAPQPEMRRGVPAEERGRWLQGDVAPEDLYRAKQNEDTEIINIVTVNGEQGYDRAAIAALERAEELSRTNRLGIPIIRARMPEENSAQDR